MKTRGENISLTPRPPTSLPTNMSRKGGTSSKKVLSPACSPRSARTDNENETSPRINNDNNDDMASPRTDVKSPRMSMEEKYADASELVKEQNKAAVNIQKLFRGHVARKHVRQLENTEQQRRKKLRKANAKNAAEQCAQSKNLKKKASSSTIHDIFHGPSRTMKNKAAVTIQRVFKGWYVRRLHNKFKQQINMQGSNIHSYVHEVYVPHLKDIMRRNGEENPKVTIQYNELLQYVNDRNKYETQFIKTLKEVESVQKNDDHVASDSKKVRFDSLPFHSLKSYLASCGLFPSKQEIIEAIDRVTEKGGNQIDEQQATLPPGAEEYEGYNKERMNSDRASFAGSKKKVLEGFYSRNEVVEMTFEIYQPKGCGKRKMRQSTWLNPLVGRPAEEAVKLLTKKNNVVKDAQLDKCLDLVKESARDR